MRNVRKSTPELYTEIARAAIAALDPDLAGWAAQQSAHLAQLVHKRHHGSYYIPTEREQYKDNHEPSEVASPGQIPDDMVPALRVHFKSVLSELVNLDDTPTNSACPFCGDSLGFVPAVVGGVECCTECAEVARPRYWRAYQSWFYRERYRRRRNPAYRAWRDAVERDL